MEWAKRFWEKVDKSGSSEHPDCWIWTGPVRSGRGAGGGDGYGTFKYQGGQYAHRASYILAHGSIPEGAQIDHLCRNRACVNPAHLEAVSASENVFRGETGLHNAVKTHCKRGHELNSENVYLKYRVGAVGQTVVSRQCKPCKLITGLASQRKRRAAGKRS